MNEQKQNNGVLKWLANLSFVKKLKSIKHIEVIILVIFFLVLLLICFGGGGFVSTHSNSTEQASTTSSYLSTKEYVQSVENRLKSVLKNIQNVGDVDVLLSVSGSVQTIFATEQTTTNGKTTENIILVNSQPVVVSEKLPEINGVVIVSSGAKDTKVKLDIIMLVQTLIDIKADKIQVFVGK